MSLKYNSIHKFYKKYSKLSFVIIFFAILNVVGCKSIEVPIDRKTITNRDYREVFYVTDKTPSPKGKRHYHWFKSQKVYASQNDYAGELLDGAYIKYYYANQLAEKGNYSNGLKKGKWTSWHKNGKVSQVTKWKSGRPSGRFVSRDSLGTITAYGKYKNGKKSGKWIFPNKKDTLYFIKGEKMVLDTTAVDSLSKKPFYKRIFLSKKERLEQRTRAKKKDSTTGFFGKIFKKKNKEKNNRENEVEPKENVKQKKKLFKIKKENTKKNNKKKNKVTKSKKSYSKKIVAKKDKELNFFQRLFQSKKKKTTTHK